MTFPGFIRPCGSSARFTERINSSSSGSLWRVISARFNWPRPCSAEIEPSSAATDRPESSARWAGPAKDFALAMQKVEERLEEAHASDFSAWFTSALAVAWPGGPAVVVEGRVDGVLTFPARGDRGFGYDPIFIPEGYDQTFGEMEPAAKDAMSHRARAFAKLKAALL